MAKRFKRPTSVLKRASREIGHGAYGPFAILFQEMYIGIDVLDRIITLVNSFSKKSGEEDQLLFRMRELLSEEGYGD